MEIKTLQYIEDKGWTTYNFSPMDSDKTLILVFAAPEFIENSSPITELVQHIACLGYWLYNKEINKFSFSKELCVMLGINPSKPTLNYEELINLIHEKNRAYFQKWIEEISPTKDAEYEME